DRVLVVEVERRGARREVVCEFLGTRWNAAVTEGPDRIVRHLLVPREGGARPVRSGFPWTPPEPTGRLGVEGRIVPEAWPARARPGMAGGEARRALQRTVAWTSSLNAERLRGPDGPERWQAIVDPERWGAFVLHAAKGPQPYPVPLEGIPSEAAPSLLQAC